MPQLANMLLEQGAIDEFACCIEATCAAIDREVTQSRRVRKSLRPAPEAVQLARQCKFDPRQDRTLFGIISATRRQDSVI